MDCGRYFCEVAWDRVWNGMPKPALESWNSGSRGTASGATIRAASSASMRTETERGAVIVPAEHSSAKAVAPSAEEPLQQRLLHVSVWMMPPGERQNVTRPLQDACSAA